MRSSTEEAISLLNKWRDERTRLDFLFSGSGGVAFGFAGFLVLVSGASFSAVRNTSADVTLTVSLSGAESFNFADPREARPGIREFVKTRLAQVLEISFSNGDRLGLYERTD